MKKINLVLFIAALIFVGCNSKPANADSSEIKTDSTQNESVATPSVYILGYQEAEDNNCARPVYWKDGVKTLISDGKRMAIPTSIAVDNYDVYITGYEHYQEDFEDIACYWKNGKKIVLGKAGENSDARGITINGSDVYITGYQGNSACIWKNGKIKLLSDGDFPGDDDEFLDIEPKTVANNILFVGQKEYIVGYRYDGKEKFACYWENGYMNNLRSHVNFAYAQNIWISGNDVLISGFTSSDNSSHKPCFWRESQIEPYWFEVGKTESKAIYISGSDNYVVGHEWVKNRNVARIWKNEKLMEIDLPADTKVQSYATVVSVLGNDVYVAGDERDGGSTICYWKNGKKTVVEKLKIFVDIKAILVQ